MKMLESLPVTLEDFTDDLKRVGLNAIVIESQIDYTLEHLSDIGMTLRLAVTKIDDSETEKSAYDRAMEVIDGKKKNT